MTGLARWLRLSCASQSRLDFHIWHVGHQTFQRFDDQPLNPEYTCARERVRVVLESKKKRIFRDGEEFTQESEFRSFRPGDEWFNATDRKLRRVAIVVESDHCVEQWVVGEVGGDL